MDTQKGLVPFFVILLIATVIGGFLIYQNRVIKPDQSTQQAGGNPTFTPVAPSVYNEATPTSTPNSSPTATPSITPQYKVHLYNHPEVSLEKIKIVGVYFIGKGNENIIMPTWKEDMTEVLNQVAEFYRKELKYSEIRVAITPLVLGRKFYNDYQYNYEIHNEIKERVLKPSGDLYSAEVAGIEPREFQTLMIYIDYTPQEIEKGPIQNFGGGLDYDGGQLVGGLATQGAFWLKREARSAKTYGVVGSAHELGHTFNILHPWGDKEINKTGDNNFGNVGGNIMGYNFDQGIERGKGRSLMDGYIMPEQKFKMGIE